MFKWKVNFLIAEITLFIDIIIGESYMKITNEKFEEEIISLIESHSEGSYWDFKCEWYHKDNLADMLHDIICMANNLDNHDGYIIIGINDDFKFNDIQKDPNRKNTQNLNDFLRDKKFAGAFRPMVEVKLISIGKYCLDIILVKNSSYVPVYLEEDYVDKHKKRVQAYHIYTRIADSNTPINKSADIIHVETLWRKRFHLFDTPLERMKYFLQEKDNWISSPDENWLNKYYKYAPEYTIIIEDDEDNKTVETYMLTQMDNTPHWGIIKLKYHQTLLFYSQIVFLDGFRYKTIAPYSASIDLGTKRIYYHYCLRNSLEFVIHNFLYDKDESAYMAHRYFIAEVLLFSDENDKKCFEFYVSKSVEKYKEYCQTIRKRNLPKNQFIPYGNITILEDDYHDSLVLKQMQSDYINSLNII